LKLYDETHLLAEIPEETLKLYDKTPLLAEIDLKSRIF